MYDLLTQEGRNQFVSDIWEALAFFGYEQFLNHGRGAVLIRGNESGPEVPRYAPLSAGCEDEQLKKLLEAYDPAQEIVCQFNLTGMETSCGQYGSEYPKHSPEHIYHILSQKQEEQP
ncbi:MAG: hypothetical protein JXD18_11855 [Anaerolineae bacterium]|nr:hypothetical protein [Anaerolineae bacterium]